MFKIILFLSNPVNLVLIYTCKILPNMKSSNIPLSVMEVCNASREHKYKWNILF